MTQHPDVAYYYPSPYWGLSEGGWIKSLLLFFDQIAIPLPDYMYGRHETADPTLVIPLEEGGLLQVLEPKDWVDEQMTNQLAGVVVELFTNGVFDDLAEADRFHELSQSRMGYGADVGLADMLLEELRAKRPRPAEREWRVDTAAPNRAHHHPRCARPARSRCQPRPHSPPGDQQCRGGQ